MSEPTTFPRPAPCSRHRAASTRRRALVRGMLWLALALYVAGLLYIVFFARRRSLLVWSPDLVNLTPLLETIREHDNIVAIGWRNYWTNILGNIALFVPLPMLVASTTGLRSRWGLVAIGLAASALIEVIQYVGRLGVPDIDDVIMNSTGVLLGVLLWEQGLYRLYRRLMR